MSVLRQALDDYLTLRRALGYHLIRSEKLINQFLDYLEHENAATITVAQALSWARLPSDATVNWWAQRLSVVRGFATYLCALDPRTEIPQRVSCRRDPRVRIRTFTPRATSRLCSR
jgi:integrase/recombinase XerD